MIKRVGLLKKRSDLSSEEFARHWYEIHTALARELTGLRKYVINIVDRAKCPDSPIDGFSELWWEDLESMQAAATSELFDRLKADEKNFTDEVRVIIVNERPIRGE